MNAAPLLGTVADRSTDRWPDLPPDGPASAGRCLPDLLRHAVAARPDDVAVAGPGERLTFADLDRRSADVAGRLRRAGVGVEDRVGVFLEASTDLVVAVWGVLRAGASYLPLSPDYPDERLRAMVGSARPAAIRTHRRLRDRLSAIAPPGLPVLVAEDEDEDGAGVAPDPGRRLRPRPDNLAYVIYTSGSTGAPKGVMIQHGGVVNQLRWLRDRHGLGPGRVVLHKTPVSFDAAQWELLANACGATVAVAGAGSHRDPGRLVDDVVRHGVTTLQCVPTLWRALLDGGRLPECGSLHQAFSGGEALPRALARQLAEALPECALVNLYGPTECTINTSSHTVRPQDLTDGPAVVPIGVAAARTGHHVLDRALRPVPPGEVGELYVSGVQLARGYLDRPDLTAQQFVTRPRPDGTGWDRLYRTGDLASWNADGTASFVGRADDQVKLRGHRIELDEVRAAVEAHTWVRQAAVVVRDGGGSAPPHLVAFVELDPTEAALMDQGRAADHHVSKRSRFQIRSQLSNPGCRDDADLAGRPMLALPGREPSPDQVRETFARKTYRRFDGGPVTRADLLALLDRFAGSAGSAGPAGRDPREVPLQEWGRILRRFGQFTSPHRLLPKYGYASPGALYGVQLHLQVGGVEGIEPGLHYYHPVHHRLVRVDAAPAGAEAPAGVVVHLVGSTRAIEPVYAHNVREVLEFEAGHLVGLLDQVLPRHGLRAVPVGCAPQPDARFGPGAGDVMLGSFALVPAAGADPVQDAAHGGVEVYLQAHPGRVADLPGGLYRYRAGQLDRLGADQVLKRHVIAINQQAFARSSFGIALVHRGPHHSGSYLDLGRRLHRLQGNDLGLGLMPSGYSSRTGHPLPAARRLGELIGDDGGMAAYFCIGGRVSPEQLRARDMAEDVVHMKGPTELIRDDLVATLPDYMVPARVVVTDRLPRTANGKLDTRALAVADPDDAGTDAGTVRAVEPRTPAEARVAAIWQQVMCEGARTTAGRDQVCVEDDFFACGGDSLLAVTLVHRINRDLGAALPLQSLFESPTVGQLARRVAEGERSAPGRLVPLRTGHDDRPVFCWPGLGGYPMNLVPLARALGTGRPVYGVQAHGINPGEDPDPDVAAMARRDLAALRERQPTGPYTLWGYSFGARIAFETAHRLERLGERVDQLVLIAPGAPRLPPALVGPPGTVGDGLDPARLAVVLSVFTGTIDAGQVAHCLDLLRGAGTPPGAGTDTLVAYLAAGLPHLDPGVIRRILRLVELTYHPEYRFEELARRRIAAPVTVLRARGDDYSFLDRARGWAERPPTVLDLDVDHYDLLRRPGLAELVPHLERAGRDRSDEGRPTGDPAVPGLAVPA